MNARRRARILIHGRVQGIGFRWSALYEARRRGLSGWVRNRRDGTVEALVEGQDVAGFLAWCEKGPPGARVVRTEVSWEPGGEVLDGFTIRTDVFPGTCGSSDFHLEPETRVSASGC